MTFETNLVFIDVSFHAFKLTSKQALADSTLPFPNVFGHVKQA